MSLNAATRGNVWPTWVSGNSAERLGRHPGSVVAGPAILGFMLALSFVATLVGGSPAYQNLAASLVGPGSAGHVLGTDPLGRDVFAWVGSGIRTSFEVSLAVVCLSAIVGSAIGIIAGYVGGWLDAVLMRLADIQLSVPPLVLFIAASAVVANSFPSLVILLSIVGWVPYARLCRARVLTQRERGYVLAARLAGRRRGAIVLLHLLPGVVSEITVLASLQAGMVLVWEAGLSFLGLGLQPPYVSLGFLMAEGKGVISQAWWVAAFPGLTLATMVLGFNLTGDSLRDFFSDDSSLGGR